VPHAGVRYRSRKAGFLGEITKINHRNLKTEEKKHPNPKPTTCRDEKLDQSLPGNSTSGGLLEMNYKQTAAWRCGLCERDFELHVVVKGE
jgi:hypothetical protein